MTRLVSPTVFLTSASKKTLVEARIDIMEAARQLLNKMQAATPRERNYPDKDTYERARTAWNERVELIERLQGEIETEAMRITLG